MLIQETADILNRQYESTSTREDKTDIPTPDGIPFSSMETMKVTEEGMLKLLLKLNPAKACGPDLIPARIRNEMANEIAPYQGLDTGQLPKD